jgi:hypothetical protein
LEDVSATKPDSKIFKILSQKYWRKKCVFVMNLDHKIGFEEKNVSFFAKNRAKIAEKM